MTHKQRRNNRILSLVLALVMVVLTLPLSAVPAQAATVKTRTAIQLVGDGNKTGGITGYDSTYGYDYIYFGTWKNAPLKWRVLDDQTNMGTDGLFLLTDMLMAGQHIVFDESSNCWDGSNAEAWCRDFAGESSAEANVPDAFTPKELGAVQVTNKWEGAYDSQTTGQKFVGTNLSGDRVFFLSAPEVENSSYGFNSNAARKAYYKGTTAWDWWLRSAVPPNDAWDAVERAGMVSRRDGALSKENIEISTPIPRPALNIDLNAVLFTSAAEGGKSGETGALSAVATTETADWKFTLLDRDRSFAVTETSLLAKPGDSLTLHYTGAVTGENEYISVILTSGTEVKYYGRIAQPTQAEGTLQVTLPGDLVEGSYTLKVFSEQYNGDYNTDYASAFAEVSLTIDATAPAVGGVTDSGTYYTTQQVTVTDANLGTVTLNGEIVTGTITLAGNKEAIYTIVAADTVGNATTISVTMEPIGRLSEPMDQLNTDNVNSDHRQTVDDVKAAVDAVDTTNATEEEKEALKAIADKADQLAQVIENTRAEIERISGAVDGYDPATVNSNDKADLEKLVEDIEKLFASTNLTENEISQLNDDKKTVEDLLAIIAMIAEDLKTENIEKVQDITPDNVTPEDKTDLEKAREDLENALEKNDSHYTEDEKNAIRDQIGRIDEALEVINRVEQVEVQINDLPANITKDDTADVDAAKNAYDQLSDYEKSLVDAGIKKKLDDAVKAAEEANKPVQEVNKPVQEANKPSDTDTPAANASATSAPMTGDNSNMALWFPLFFISGGALVTLNVCDKKRRTIK